MSTEDRKRIISDLIDYFNIKKKIAILRHEPEHPVSVSPEEMLESMNFAHGDGGGFSGGSISNKTLYIAMNYQNAANQANAEITDQILARLLPLEQKLKRMDYYLGLLAEDEERVIRQFYIERQRANEIASAMHTSVWSARRIRDKAVDKLAEMISFAEGGDWE